MAYTAKVGANPQNALLSDLRGADRVRDPDDDLPRPIIAAGDGSRVVVASDNDDVSINVENQAPDFSDPSPAVGDASASEGQIVSIDITDNDQAGVDEDTVEFYFRVGTASTKATLTGDEAISYKLADGSDLDFEDIDGGVRVSVALDDVDDGNLRVNASRTPTILWYVKATDNANNEGTSDAVTDDDDDASTQGNQVYKFTVDSEETEIDKAYAGEWFNPATERVEGNRRLGTGQYLPGSASNTSIRVVFKEPIDGTSVSADDFTVDGEEPLAAMWYDEGDTSPFEDPDNSPITASVFLTVPAMEADETREVIIVGSISDKAGNATTSGTKTAVDSIAPTLTLEVDQMLSDEKVIVTVESDERIRTQSPSVSLYVSNALDANNNNTLDEQDTFRVRCEIASKDNDRDDAANCDLGPVAVRRRCRPGWDEP